MNKKNTLNFLSDFLSIQSVSADSQRYSEILKAADFLKKKLSSLGFEIQFIEKENVPPLIIAKKIISKDAKTIGIYGHYDVQPEDPIDEWNSEPFTLLIEKGKMFGRGIADNKGHIVQNIFAIEELIQSESLKHNVLMVLEGEEESGSDNFENFVLRAQEQLKDVDVFFITDMGMHAKNLPQIFYALRGLTYFELKVEIGKRDLHSGVYGNQVYNPGQIVSTLMAMMKDISTNEVTIPGFYENVREIPVAELKLLEKTEISDEDLIQEANTKAVISLKNSPTYLVSKIYPSCDIHGMNSGYTGEGPKTIIPRSASVKFSFRLIEHQEPKKIVELVQNFVAKNIPVGVDFDLKVLSADAPFYTEINNEYVQKAAQIMSEEFGNDTLFNRSGGSIPAAEILQRVFGKPIILTGFTLPDDNIHSPNENFDEEMFWKGIEVLKRIYSEL